MLKRFSSNEDCPRKQLVCNDIQINARLADTSEQREKGLMGVKSLSENEGCLLDFESEQPISLWMRNVPIDLDVAFINSTGIIVAIDHMLSEADIIYRSPSDVRYALEMSKGFFDKNGIKEGDTVLL